MFDCFSVHVDLLVSICYLPQERTQGGGGVKPLLEIHIFQKLYYLRKGD